MKKSEEIIKRKIIMATDAKKLRRKNRKRIIYDMYIIKKNV